MRLTKRRPAEPEASFADTLPPPEETAVLRLGLSREALREEADQQRIRAEMAEQERDRGDEVHAEQDQIIVDLRRQNRVLRDEVTRLAERDDLDVRSLPSLAAYLTEPFDEPIPDDAAVDDNPTIHDLSGTWPPVFGDLGAHYDREIGAEVSELAALVAETGTEPVEVAE
jgi:hypothetical protein